MSDGSRKQPTQARLNRPRVRCAFEGALPASAAGGGDRGGDGSGGGCCGGSLGNVQKPPVGCFLNWSSAD